MAIFYTIHESGLVARLPLKASNQKIIKHLRRCRRKIGGVYFSHIPMPKGLPYLVSSVFFIKGSVVTKIWDASTGDYRNLDRFKNLKVYKRRKIKIHAGI